MLSVMVSLVLATPSVQPHSWDSALANPHPRVLVFSKTAGFRHDSIPDGIAAIKKLGSERGFTVEATEDSTVFSDESLSHLDAVVFLSTTGDILNEAQQRAMEKFVTSGGGFVGVHAAADTEYDWPWYGELVGAWFRNHPAIQQAKILVEDHSHPSTCDLPDEWTRTDEWYNFRTSPRGKVRVLASMDETSYQGGNMNHDHPIMWCRKIGAGRMWYTNLGHRKETWQEQPFLDSLAEGIVWTCQAKRPDGAETPTWRQARGWELEGSAIVPHEAGLPLLSQRSYRGFLTHLEFQAQTGAQASLRIGDFTVRLTPGVPKGVAAPVETPCGALDWTRSGSLERSTQPPTRYAALPAGDWNTLDVLFRPQTGSTRDSEVGEVRLNGVVVQRNIQGPPTKAQPIGLVLDRGKAAFRNVWIKSLPQD